MQIIEITSYLMQMETPVDEGWFFLTSYVTVSFLSFSTLFTYKI